MKQLFVIILCSIVLITSCQTENNMETVKNVDLQKYTGVWYEIARMPFRQEEGLTNITATYTLRDDGKIIVLNQGYKNSPDGKLSKATGKAWVPNPDEPGKLKVSFFRIFKSDYNIIALDTVDYQYSLVASIGGKYAWILGRKPQMADEIYNKLVDIAKNKGIEVEKLIKPIQKWN